MKKSTERLKGIIVGSGYFAQFHIEAWHRLNMVEILAICDHDILKAQESGEKYGIKDYFTSFEEAIKLFHPDFVDIVTPPHSHLDLCRIAAKNQCHIIVQKPLAPTYEEALKIQNLETEYGVRIMVHENFRFQPWHRVIKSLLDLNTIGIPLNTLWRMRMGDGWQSNAYIERQPYFREMPRLLI